MELTRLAERFSHGIGGAIALAFIAFSVVFMVLVGLTLIIFAVRYLAAALDRKGGGESAPAKPKPEPQKPAAEKAAPSGEAGAGTDGALIAAIAAAVAASGGGVVTAVRKVTPIGNAIGQGRAWKMAGRPDLMEGMD